MTSQRSRSFRSFWRSRLIGVVVIALALLPVTACAAGLDTPEGDTTEVDTPEGGAISSTDRRAIDQLGEIAPRGSGASPAIDGEVTGVECWLPSEHVIEGTGFRVLCRVHYLQRDGDGDGDGDSAGAEPHQEAEHDAAEHVTAERYRDMICIGDTATDPVSDGCYEWAYYTDAPAYEDELGVFAAPLD